MILAPSIIASNFMYLEKTIKEIENLNFNVIHIDVMDGHFVPEITIGASFIENLKAFTRLQLDVHLMIKDPDLHVKRYINAGSDIISFQIETAKHPYRICQEIIDSGKVPGVAVNPGTPIEIIFPLLPVLKQVTIMTVNPGYSRQKMIENCLDKICKLKKYPHLPQDLQIKVDGGVNQTNIFLIKKLGATCAVIGGALFNDNPPKENLEKLHLALNNEI